MWPHLVIAAVVAIVVAQALGSLARYVRIFRVLSQLPGPPALSAVRGHASAIKSPSAPLLVAEWARTYGPLFRIRLGYLPAVVLTDHAVAKAALMRGPSYLPKSSVVYNAWRRAVDTPPLPHVVTSFDTPYHKAVRSALAGCFTTTSLKAIFPYIISQSEALAARLAAASSGDHSGGAAVAVDVVGPFKSITAAVIAKHEFDEDSGAEEMIALATRMVAVINKRTSSAAAQLLGSWAESAQDQAVRVAYSAFKTRRARAVMRAPPPPHTVAAQLLQVIDPGTGQPLTLEQLRAELGIVEVAGFETTSHTLCWTLAAIGSHRSVQERVMQELELLGLLSTPHAPAPRSMQWEDLSRLPYLTACIREAMRLLPALPVVPLARETPCDTTLCGFRIPKGTLVIIPIIGLGRSEAAYGADADAFRPERWLPGAASGDEPVGDAVTAVRVSGGSGGGVKEAGAAEPAAAVMAVAIDDARVQSVADHGQAGDMHGVLGAVGGTPATVPVGAGIPDNLPFSAGPRDCVGQGLAKVEMLAVLATLLGRCRVALAPEAGGFEALQRERMHYCTTLNVESVPMLLTPHVPSPTDIGAA